MRQDHCWPGSRKGDNRSQAGDTNHQSCWEVSIESELDHYLPEVVDSRRGHC